MFYIWKVIEKIVRKRSRFCNKSRTIKKKI